MISGYYLCGNRLTYFCSTGGNMVVNVGPTPDGRIAPVFEDRLRQMGEWLAINGEGIYSTKPWRFQNDTYTPDIWYNLQLSALYLNHYKT